MREKIPNNSSLFTYVMCCDSSLYVEKMKSEELIAIFLPTVLLLK